MKFKIYNKNKINKIILLNLIKLTNNNNNNFNQIFKKNTNIFINKMNKQVKKVNNLKSYLKL